MNSESSRSGERKGNNSSTGGTKKLILDPVDSSPEIEFRAFLRSKTTTSTTPTPISNKSNTTHSTSTTSTFTTSIPVSQTSAIVINPSPALKISSISEIGVLNTALSSPSFLATSSSTSSSSSPRTVQKVKRKPSPKDSISPEDEALEITNLDLIYPNTSPPLSLNFSPVVSSTLTPSIRSHNEGIIERPFLSPEIGQTKEREGVFPLVREIPTTLPFYPSSLPLPQSPVDSESSCIPQCNYSHRHQDSITSLAELIPNENVVESGDNRRDSLMESSFSRMQDMFDNHLVGLKEGTAAEEKEVEEVEEEMPENSIVDIMLKQKTSLEELLEDHESIMEALGNAEDDTSAFNRYEEIELLRTEIAQQSQDRILVDESSNIEEVTDSDPQSFLPTPAPSPSSKPSQIGTSTDLVLREPSTFSLGPVISDSQHRGSVGSLESEASSGGPMTPPTPFVEIRPLSIQKTFTSLGIMEEYLIQTKSDNNELDSKIVEEDSADSGNSSPRSLSTSSSRTLSRRAKGPPPPRPKRLRLPGTVTSIYTNSKPASPTFATVVVETVDVQSGNNRFSNVSTSSQPGFPFTRRASQISVPPTPPPLFPLPATPIQKLPSSPPSLSPVAQNYRQSFTNPFEKNFEVPKINSLQSMEFNRQLEVSPALSGNSFNSTGEDDKSRNPESFFYRPTPPRTSSIPSRNSVSSLPMANSEESQTAYSGLGLGLSMPIESTANSSTDDSSVSSTSNPLSALPSPDEVVEKHSEIIQEGEVADVFKVESNQDSIIDNHESVSHLTFSPKSPSLSESMLANAGGAIVYGGLALGYGAWASLSWSWNTLNTLPLSITEMTESTGEEDKNRDESEYKRKRKEILIPGSFRPITPMLEEENEVVEEGGEGELELVGEIEGFKDYSKVFSKISRRDSRSISSKRSSLDITTTGLEALSLPSQVEDSSSEIGTPQLASPTSTLVMPTLESKPKEIMPVAVFHSHSRESSSSTGSTRTVRTNEYRAPLLSPDSPTPKYIAPPGLDFPPPAYHTPNLSISSTSTSIGNNRPPSIAPSTISEKSASKRRSSFFGFGSKSSNKKYESPPPLPPPIPLSSVSSIASSSSDSKSKSSNNIPTRPKSSGVESSIRDATYVEYFSGRSSARRSSSVRLTSPDRRNFDAFPSSLTPTKSNSSDSRNRSILRKESSFSNSRKRTVSMGGSDIGGEADKTIYSVRFANATKGLGLRSVAESESLLDGGGSHALKWIGVGNGTRYGNLTLQTDEASDELYAEQVKKIRTKWRGFGNEQNWSSVRID